MVWTALLYAAPTASLALIPTTLDRFVVWGALALVVALIAWRQYTLPETSAALPAGEPDARPGARR